MVSVPATTSGTAQVFLHYDAREERSHEIVHGAGLGHRSILNDSLELSRFAAAPRIWAFPTRPDPREFSDRPVIQGGFVARLQKPIPHRAAMNIR